MVVAVNYSIHHDPRYWEDPHTFNPDRFIDDDGKFKAPKEGFFAFGSGKSEFIDLNLVLFRDVRTFCFVVIGNTISIIVTIH